MLTIEYADEVLRLISQAWGPSDNIGYCFFPWIEGADRKFYTKSFLWPMQRPEILDHLIKHEDDDLYWCPVLFSEAKRRTEFANEEYALWADLDESDPHKIDERWRPSVTWETSPGRYQALWLLEDPDEEDLYGASKRGADNHRMTVMVDADPSGWDTTQLLRLPGWVNHKPQYLGEGGFPEGRLLWSDGPRYTGQDFNHLPVVGDDEDEVVIDDDLFAQVEAVELGEVMDRIRHILPKKVLARLTSTPGPGEDRSQVTAYLMICLAEVGCSIAEIVAVIRPTRWNKFKGRPDELDRLTREATKQFEQHSPQRTDKFDYVPQNVNDYMAAATPPRWLVRDMLVRGNVGFIGGEPKARKSWVALDLAMSIAASSSAHQVDFLGQFRVEKPGPVLYFVLEDGAYMVKNRIKQVWAGKTKYDGTRLVADGRGGVEVSPLNGRVEAHLAIVSDCVVNFSDQTSMDSIHQVIREGYPMADGSKTPYALVIFDTFMRSVGGSDINSMGEMMNIILAPLTKLAKRNDTTILLVHHFNKSQREGETRGGTRLLGSQALHAWAEDSLYLTAGDHGFTLELESKTAPANRWDFITDPTQRTWSPRLRGDNTPPVRELDFAHVNQPQRSKNTRSKTYHALKSLGPGLHTTREVITAGGQDWAPGYTHSSLKGLVTRGLVVKEGTLWRLTDPTL